MTTTAGREIKKKRLEMGLTQSELSENICTQATVSNLENGVSEPTLSILLKLADKLDIEFSDIMGYSIDIERNYDKLFNEVRELCSRALHRDAHELLTSTIDFDKLDTINEAKLYFYFMGITSLTGLNQPTDAIYYFNQVLASESELSHDFLNVSAMNGIGIAYHTQNENEKALTYFDKSLDRLAELLLVLETINNSPEVAKIYYNSAKYYSEIGEYNKAITICNLGIELLREEGLYYFLDFLVYEKAFNLMKLGKNEYSEKLYLNAVVLADLNKNKILMDIIKSDVIEYNIEGYKYY